MLVETKARVGVFAIALGAYLPQFPSLVPEFEGQYEAFKKTLPGTVEIIDGGIVTTKELAMEAGDKFRAADVDLVIFRFRSSALRYLIIHQKISKSLSNVKIRSVRKNTFLLQKLAKKQKVTSITKYSYRDFATHRPQRYYLLAAMQRKLA